MGYPIDIIGIELPKVIHRRVVKKLAEENIKGKLDLKSKRNLDNITTHLYIMYIEFGEDLFKITDLKCKKYLDK